MKTDLRAWGLDQWETATSGSLDPDRVARVVRVDRGECDVITAAGRLRVFSDSQRAQDETAPVTGDWVDLSESEGLGTVMTHIHARLSQVARRDPAERDTEQVLAANADVVAVVHGLDRALPSGRLERLLVIALDSGAEPLVILSKADRAPSDDHTEAIVRSVAADVPVIRTSTTDGTGLDRVLAMIGPGRTMALIGASGVGKSSLVNVLLGAESLSVGDVRTRDGKGRHTTTARELLLLADNGGLMLDTPGIRALGLWEAEHALDILFGDLVERADGCRFRDCRHHEEPGCAVVEAASTGEVDHLRVERFRGLSDELAEQRQREDARTRGKNAGRGPGRGRR